MNKEEIEKPMPVIGREEFFAISRSLEKHHAVFYKLWELGKPVFDPSIPTAQVEFSREGIPVSFVFSPTFWERLSPYEREFIIAHECLHVVLNHGIRGRDSKTDEMNNVAMDIVVNHLLVDKFEYDRKQLSMNKNICWVDTVFKDKKILRDRPGTTSVNAQLVDAKTPGAENIRSGESFEYYYVLLRQEAEKSPGFKALLDLLEKIDSHGGLSGQNVDDLLKQLDDSLSDGEKDEIKDVINKNYQSEKPSKDKKAGEGTGSWTFVRVGSVKKKKKWETVIKVWSRKYWKPAFREMEQWARLSRRYALLNSNLMLPSEMEVEHDDEQKGKIDVWFFQDTSGSCIHLKDRFFKAALSLPPERFHVRLFCFDTKVRETTLQSKRVYGGGGTSFKAIEDHVQATIAQEKSKHPEAVFVITDGAGNRVLPQCPERWYFFLSTNHKVWIPKESRVYMLRDFE